MQPLSTIVFLLLWKQVHSCNTSHAQRDKKLQGHVIAVFTSVQTSLDCVEKCALHADCHSINYYSRRGICEVNNANHLTNPESLVCSAGCQYLNYFLRAASRCSNSLCRYPLVCTINSNGQSYVCLPCQELGIKEVVSFPRKGTEDKIVYELLDDVSLTAFTISMWVQPDPSTARHCPFCYATRSQPNEISVMIIDSYTELGIFGLYERSYPSLLDGKWHHICATWQNFDGSYKMYIDGKKKGNDGSTMRGHIIREGALVLGQEQDSYKGSFAAYQSFQGNLSSVNMWDRVLTDQEISALARKCPTQEGNFIAWSTLKNKTSSGLQLTCANECV